MPINCPNCRLENATTTRFCTACGAVLVESLPGGGRRRVLRPWGLRKSAPLTESPAMPEIAAAHRAAQRASGAPGSRLDLVFAAGVALVAVAGLFAYPYASADETSRASRDDERPMPRTTAVAVPTLATVRESTVSAPPLVEPLPGAATPTSRAARAARPAEAGQRPAARAAPAASIPVTFPMPAREAVITGDGQSVDPPAPPAEPPRAQVDPWQPLRDALFACARLSGVWERATCEQRARLAHCDGYWGNVALCPSGRTEFGQ
jgi:hypothetical protein